MTTRPTGSVPVPSGILGRGKLDFQLRSHSQRSILAAGSPASKDPRESPAHLWKGLPYIPMSATRPSAAPERGR